MNSLRRLLDVEDAVLIGYLLGLAVYAWLLDTDREGYNEQDVLLTEDHLRRMETGESVRVERWHGHSVELHADLVVDAGQLEAEDVDES